MRFSLFIAISAIAGYVTAASLPLEERLFGLCIEEDEYCCTWEGCSRCCGYCDLTIDAAQGRCVDEFIF
ncbi:hypothetical protein ASPFODRAFT_201081 [Aspergillus luchuensis CBS 106.47]|uniref:Uncharacterized protein n=1 Tax=Aspergillus luchuensis (strain CBS 106.47) TaxID=1137211 RepID=A0A1M3SZQ7_ASPLC|nr:hypothetical protein ASPFODRAFT_201081 [Aspergillus luchuensis CBS 106.47]